MSFSGLRVLSLESRRSAEMATLIRKQDGTPFTAPSMREVPLEENPEAFAFAEALFAGDFDMLILLTGVGTRHLAEVLAIRYPPERFLKALRTVTLVARGPKPMAVLREWSIPAQILVPEPNTWREILLALQGRPERRIAIQEYGRPSVELIDVLRGRGAQVTSVPVYQWALPEDSGPLREGARRLAADEFQIALFTTSVQIDHLLRVAEDEGLAGRVRDALGRVVVASIGPTTSEALREHGISPDLEPSHPKMGILVAETAARAHSILEEKNGKKL